MSKPASGFLANDGSFFEDEPECQRYEAERDLMVLCDTHGVNYENFIATLDAWHNPIGRYYDADDKCKVHQVGRAVRFEEPERARDGFVDESFDIPAFLPAKEDRTDDTSGDKDAPGFLELALRKHQ
jgi:hypothetical protein